MYHHLILLYIITAFNPCTIVSSLFLAVKNNKGVYFTFLNSLHNSIPLPSLPDTYKVYKNDEELNLTTVSYEILFSLIKAHGKVVTREQLLSFIEDTKGYILPSLILYIIQYHYHQVILYLQSINLYLLTNIILNAGGDDYVCKPFSIIELNARINSLLRRVEIHQQRILLSFQYKFSRYKHLIFFLIFSYEQIKYYFKKLYYIC